MADVIALTDHMCFYQLFEMPQTYTWQVVLHLYNRVLFACHIKMVDEHLSQTKQIFLQAVNQICFRGCFAALLYFTWRFFI